MTKVSKIIFFGNGNTFASSEMGEQMPELQQSWMRLYIDFLVSKGIDPTKIEFELPHGKASVFKWEDGDEVGYNWKM